MDDDDLHGWARANEIACLALIEGKAAVVPLIDPRDRKRMLTSVGFKEKGLGKQSHTLALHKARLDKPGP